ncbi:hypothetical protein FD63_02295 [Xanthomonas translucens pv. undulosa]|nr:hypothetical protein FD63_02295 [Xanthomonas translucens pv. undulosa]
MLRISIAKAANLRQNVVLQRMTRQFDLNDEPMRQGLVNKCQVRNATLTLQDKRSSEYAAAVFRHQARQRFYDFGLEVSFDICRWIDKLKNVVGVALAGQ